MNKIRELAYQKGVKLVWLGRQIDLDRAAFNNRINRDRFSDGERRELAGALGVAVDELFPEPDPSPEAA